MAVMMPREKWTDERLDDLNKKVDGGFARLDRDIKDLRGEMNARFEKVDARFENLEARLDARFEALNRNLIAGLFVVVAAIVGSSVF